ncbi:MAG: ATP-binding cassette domain-containing protein [Chlamydiia bacterium]|nr:ATP-binding cassette domain-containing protein [Chlamydiia bacterium]
MTNKRAIEISNLSFSYQGFAILKKIQLRVEMGECIGIIGPNGGGKTTFLKLLMGFLKPQAGTVTLFGHPPEKGRTRIGYVPQIHRMDRDFPITVGELILLGNLSKIPKIGAIPKELEDQADALMEELGLLAYKKQPFASLSGGQAQKALFCRALLSDPDLLLLDEPIANVDPHSTKQILTKLDALRGQKTILFVTHDLPTILERVDRILCIHGHLHSLLPAQVCEHFALGLYHTPLIDLPKNHFESCHDCATH